MYVCMCICVCVCVLRVCVFCKRASFSWEFLAEFQATPPPLRSLQQNSYITATSRPHHCNRILITLQQILGLQHCNTHSHHCNISCVHVWHDSYAHVWHDSYAHVWHDSHAHVWHDSFTRAYSRHSNAWHDPFIHVTCTIHTCDDERWGAEVEYHFQEISWALRPVVNGT